MIAKEIIEGIKMEKGENYALCRVEFVSDELKDKIRKELSSISFGVVLAEDEPEIYDYHNTLEEFLSRYNLIKSENIKKGMVGELLAHLLIPEVFDNLDSVSVLFNKEDPTIRKGFDIIYCNIPQSALWFSEVKSGNNTKGISAEKVNRGLLGKAHNGLKSLFKITKNYLWYSALSDLRVTLKNKKDYASVKDLLQGVSPLFSPRTSKDKNALLVSVLYEDISNFYTLDSLEKVFTDFIDKGDFKNLIIFSIQKETYQGIAKFLESEIATAKPKVLASV